MAEGVELVMVAERTGRATLHPIGVLGIGFQHDARLATATASTACFWRVMPRTTIRPN